MQNSEVTKIIMPLSECAAGMVVLQPIVDVDTGRTLVGKNQLLTEDILKRIRQFKHAEIWIGINKGDESLWHVEKESIAAHKKYVDMLKNIIGNKNKEIPLKIGEIESLAKCITEEFECNFNLFACVNLVKNVDKDIYMHSVNVTFLSLLIARWINYNPQKLQQIAVAALLHDVGKVDMPNYLLNKAGKFTIREKIEIRRHPIYGYEKLSKYNELDTEVLKAVIAHHERCDGSGYPLNLTEDRINDIARIIGIADEYDNLRKDATIFETIKILKCDMIRKFDINMLLEFCNNVINYYIGENVLLSTGEIGEVVFIQPQALHRPIVKVNDKYVDLYEDPNIEIIKVL